MDHFTTASRPSFVPSSNGTAPPGERTPRDVLPPRTKGRLGALRRPRDREGTRRSRGQVFRLDPPDAIGIIERDYLKGENIRLDGGTELG
jgi:hypothetical protein